MQSLVGGVGFVVVRDCKRERHTVPAEYTLMHTNMQECSPNNPLTTPKYSQSIEEVSMGISLVTDCTHEQRRTVQLECTPHNPALILN